MKDAIPAERQARLPLYFFHSMFRFLDNLFKFKAKKNFNRGHTSCIPRIKIFFPTPKLDKLAKLTNHSELKGKKLMKFFFKTGKIRILMTASLLLLTMAFIVSCQTPAGRSAGDVVDDSTISTKVKAKLFDDQLLSGFAIDVETFEGEVTLTGGVKSLMLKRRAGNIAASVRGVRAVNNLLKVQ